MNFAFLRSISDVAIVYKSGNKLGCRLRCSSRVCNAFCTPDMLSRNSTNDLIRLERKDREERRVSYHELSLFYLPFRSENQPINTETRGDMVVW